MVIKIEFSQGSGYLHKAKMPPLAIQRDIKMLVTPEDFFYVLNQVIIWFMTLNLILHDKPQMNLD